MAPGSTLKSVSRMKGYLSNRGYAKMGAEISFSFIKQKVWTAGVS